MPSTVVSLSGGLDSTTLLYRCLNINAPSGAKILAVSFDYGSRHNPLEIAGAKRICKLVGVEHRVISLRGIFGGKSSLMGGSDIPQGHYTDASMTSTVVPGRNIVFLSILAGIAMEEEIESIAIGVHSGDHPIYPDCRPSFIEAMARALSYGTELKVVLHSPFLFSNKGQIVREGLLLKVPYELTRTCYQNEEIACGKCGSCVERLEAFAQNGVNDPIAYQS